MTVSNSKFNGGRTLNPAKEMVTRLSSPVANFPSFTSLSLKDVFKLDLRGFHLSVKKDGVTAEREMFGALFVGELMPNNDFWAIDIKRIGTQEISKWSKYNRWTALSAFEPRGLKIVPSGFGKEFCESVAADKTIEGFVGANWQAPFGYDIFKWKHQETFDVRVIEKLQGAVAISFENQDAGKVALSGLNYDLVKVGDVIEISAMKRNVSGKFREPKFLKVRHDKI